MREPPDRSNHAGWSSGNYLVLRAISRRITGHADGSLKGQMALTGAERDDLGHGNAGGTSRRHLIKCTSELDALHAGIRNPKYTGGQGRGLLFFQFSSISPSVDFYSVSGPSPSLSTEGTFDSLSPSPVPLPAYLRRICWSFSVPVRMSRCAFPWHPVFFITAVIAGLTPTCHLSGCSFLWKRVLRLSA